MTKPVYRIRNWNQYNNALVRRGSLTLWVDQDTLQAWRYQGPTQRGAQFEYSDTAIECLLTLRSVYHLTLRATEGFATSLLELMLVDLPVPDYSTLCRRAATVRITLPKRAEGPLHLVLDSTGLKVYGEGEWKVRQHGYSKRRTWLKLHLAVDPQTHEIQAAVVSEPGVTDAEAVPSLLEQVEDPIEGASGDGMYDRRAVYAELERREARAVIPPRRDAQIQRHGNTAGPRLARDENLRRIRKVGRAAWKEESGYHRRSLAETAMFRMKTIFGPGVSSRKDGQRATEAGVRCRALNIMTHQGMPWTVRVA
ncbi:MAG TPA: IS5 family transposase [Isosphaeraceae bacterium]|nr:IS5 family transposase [Isosphaeraceae bacterium]